MHRLAQIMARGGEKAALRIIGKRQLMRALRDSGFLRRIDRLQPLGHPVELRSERLELISRFDVDSLVEPSFADLARAGSDLLYRPHHALREHQTRGNRRNHAEQHQRTRSRNRCIDWLKRFRARLLGEHRPSQTLDRHCGRDHGQSVHVACVAAELFTIPAAAKGGTYLRQPRKVGSAQHQSRIGMRDEPAYVVDDVNHVRRTDPALSNQLAHEFQIDVGDDRLTARISTNRKRDIRLSFAAEID